MAALMLPEQQLALPVQLPDHALFDNFVSEDNHQLVAHLQHFTDARWQSVNQFNLLFGGAARGKTHLLCALCEAFARAGRSCIYLPLAEFTQPHAVSALAGIEQYDLVALDDIDAVVAQAEWSEALFALVNRMLDKRSGYLVCTAQQNQLNLPVQLADLRSRLQLAITFSLKPLSDGGKIMALQQHAHARGLELADDVAVYMLQRLSRDMHQLMSVLEQLDSASMARQRRLTLPFVKQVLQL